MGARVNRRNGGFQLPSFSATVFDRRLLIIAPLAAAALAGCGSSSSSSSTPSPSTPAASTPAASTPTASTPAASATTTTSSSPTNSAAAAQTLHVSAVPGKLAFNTTKLTAKAGKVTIDMANPSTFMHGMAISGNGVKKVGPIVGNGGSSSVSMTLKPGTYTFYCPVPGHEAAGMKGTLTVS
jgi:plastocyanin